MSTTIYCTVHCDVCDSGSCEHAEKAREAHNLTLASGMIRDEPINAREFYRDVTEYGRSTGLSSKFAAMETWTVGMFHLTLELSEFYAEFGRMPF